MGRTPTDRPSVGARLALAVLASTVAALALLPSGAAAAKHCRAPGDGGWQRATPAEAGMDAAKLQSAIDYATSQQGLAVRVYRYGCLVGSDQLASVNNDMRFESWSMAKSVSSLLFGRAMTQGKICLLYTSDAADE